jgi:hypothetical protein
VSALEQVWSASSTQAYIPERPQFPALLSQQIWLPLKTRDVQIYRGLEPEPELELEPLPPPPPLLLLLPPEEEVEGGVGGGGQEVQQVRVPPHPSEHEVVHEQPVSLLFGEHIHCVYFLVEERSSVQELPAR